MVLLYILMKSLAILAILVIFAPIAAYAQAPMSHIEIIGDATSVQVSIQGEIADEGTIYLTIRGSFGSEPMKAYFETSKITINNPSHVFDLDYPFKSNEAYTATVRNGYTSNIIEWIPLPIIEDTQEQVQPVNEQKSSQESVEQIPFAFTQDEQTSAYSIQSLMEENEFLKQEIEKKDAVIMEQIKVIQDLASKITNIIYEEGTGKLYFIADGENSIESLIEENEFLKQEIEKKDAVIMEQIKVIQDLASMLTNSNYFTTLNNFVLV